MPGFIEVPVSNLVKADWNYKDSQPELVEKLTANIRRNGQVVNIIVRELPDDRYEVVNGNHRLEAFLAAGIEEAHAYNMGDVSLAEAKRVAVETNETRFDTDQEAFAELMAELTTEFDDFDLTTTMPFDDQDLLNFQAMANGTIEILDDKPKKDKARKDKRRRAVCPNCQKVFDMAAGS